MSEKDPKLYKAVAMNLGDLFRIWYCPSFVKKAGIKIPLHLPVHIVVWQEDFDRDFALRGLLLGQENSARTPRAEQLFKDASA